MFVTCVLHGWCLLVCGGMLDWHFDGVVEEHAAAVADGESSKGN